MMQGETMMTGAGKVCRDCNEFPLWGVYRSAAGYYVGTYCGCGPYSRESDYFRSDIAAKAMLESLKRYFNEVEA